MSTPESRRALIADIRSRIVPGASCRAIARSVSVPAHPFRVNPMAVRLMAHRAGIAVIA